MHKKVFCFTTVHKKKHSVCVIHLLMPCFGKAEIICKYLYPVSMEQHRISMKRIKSTTGQQHLDLHACFTLLKTSLWGEKHVTDSVLCLNPIVKILHANMI